MRPWSELWANGSGKSSIAGAFLRSKGEDYFNPDDATRAIIEGNLPFPREEANAAARMMGRDALMAAIENRTSYAFETTLGGKPITGLLLKATNTGLEVRVWYGGSPRSSSTSGVLWSEWPGVGMTYLRRGYRFATTVVERTLSPFFPTSRNSGFLTPPWRETLHSE